MVRSQPGLPTALPSSSSSPSVGCSKPAIMLSSVVLPQPEWPSSAQNSLSATVKLTPLQGLHRRIVRRYGPETSCRR